MTREGYQDKWCAGNGQGSRGVRVGMHAYNIDRKLKFQSSLHLHGGEQDGGGESHMKMQRMRPSHSV